MIKICKDKMYKGEYTDKEYASLEEEFGIKFYYFEDGGSTAIEEAFKLMQIIRKLKTEKSK